MNKAPVLSLPFLLIFLAVSEAIALPRVATYEGLLQAIRETRAASQARIEAAVEQEKVREAWETGRLIDEHILLHKERASYGEQVLERLAKDLNTSQTELSFMLQFARAYPINSPANKLSWAHYRELLSLNDAREREEVSQQAQTHSWTRDQIREEVRRRKGRGEAPVELPAITPGPLNTYQIIRLKGRLKIDLGFGVYFDLPVKDAKKFKEGDIVENRGQVTGSLGTGNLSPVLPEADEAISLFTYSATVTQVVDGDTFHALIDLGFGITVAQRVRLRRIDAPEILSIEGKEAKAYLEKILFRDQGRIILQSRDLDQHGRPIADVWVQDKPVDQELLNKGLAVRLSE